MWNTKQSPQTCGLSSQVVATNDHRMREYRDLRERGPEPVAEDLRMALQELLRKAELNGELGLPRVGDGGH